MKKTGKKIPEACIALFALVFVVLALPAQAADRDQAPRPLPEIKKDCSLCHLMAGPGKPQGLKKRPSQLCLDCHGDRKAPREHVVDVVPKMTVKGLPLTDNRMTCITCHDPHRNDNGRMLRIAQKDLCLACHRI